MKDRAQAALAASFLPLLAAPAAAGVILNEVHYHPPAADGRALEFIELYNTGLEAVSIAGWRLQGGIALTFPEGARIEAGGYAIACKDCSLLHQRFPGTKSGWLGDYQGSLDNAGDTVELVDEFHAVVDAVTYDHALPWPTEADGQGASLERLCETAPSWDPHNWTAGIPPSPIGPNRDARCPPPAPATPPVVITEVHYHPFVGPEIHPAGEDGEDEEFIELHNPGSTPVSLDGWSFADGIEFAFRRVTIPPGGYLAVCRDEEKVRARYGITNTVGNFLDVDRLSNRGERIALVDDRQRHVDAVNYADSGDWPHGPDGFGRSLEKVVVALPGSDPANWKTSTLRQGSFLRVSGDGGLGQGISRRLLIFIDGEGEMVVDNVAVEDLTQPGGNLLVNGDFESGMDGWIAGGTLAASAHLPGGGVGGSGALRVVSSGPCPNGECGTANSVNIRLPDGLDAEHTYRVSAEVRYVRGSVAFRAGLHRGAVAAIRNLPSPGRENSVAGTELPIFITSENRFPDQPRSEDPVWITVRVRAKAPPAVTLTHRATGQDTAVPMFDDGRHRDGPAGDGVYGVELPPFPHDTKVPYRITAVLGSETAEFPRPLDAGRTLLSEMSGYYVNDRQESSLPMVHILLDGLDGPPSFESLNKFLNCITPRPGAFAAGGDLYSDVGVRFRGHTACVEMFRKKNLKVVFNKGRLWRPTTQLLGRPTTQPGGRGLKKANFNGMWTDKALVREHLAWDFVRQIGAPYYETRYTRVHINGIHHGLFLYLEHHGDDFLDRNGLNAGGNLYLARQPSRPRPIGVERFATEEELARNWEKETNESSDFSDLLEFVNAMHADGRSAGGPSKEFWQERTFEEMTIGYQVAQVVLNNIDSLVKNHLLFHDLEADRWGYLIWDLDLTFGKFFDPQAVQHPERPVGTLNDFMLSDPGVNGDLNPWFGSTVLGNPLYNHLVNFFFQAGGGHYQRAHLVRIWDLLQEKYRNEEYNPRLDEILASLQEEEALDHARWGRYPTNVAGFPEEMDLNLEVIKSQIALHREFLLDFIRQFHPQIPAHPRMKITEVMYWPEKGDDRLEFLEILNPGDGPVDISGWTIQGIGGDVGDFVFPKDAVIPPGEHAIVARSPAAFRARYGERQFLFGPYPGKLANEGEEIRLLDAGPGHPATIDYLRYGDEAPWPEVSPGRSIELTRASLDRDNDVPEYWVASRSLGGSPGRSAAHFVRGDANGDLATNLTDGIRILQVLFQGAAQPPCFDALDANDDGDLTVSDPVYLLQHLFRSGPALPPPYPTEGSDPTPDGLDCRW